MLGTLGPRAGRGVLLSVRGNQEGEVMDDIIAEIANNWTAERPSVPGAYFIRGYQIGAEHETALVEVRKICGELVCNIHRENSDQSGFEYPIDSLSQKFEWCGPLVTPASVGRAREAEREACARVCEEIGNRFNRNGRDYANGVELQRAHGAWKCMDAIRARTQTAKGE